MKKVVLQLNSTLFSTFELQYRTLRYYAAPGWSFCPSERRLNWLNPCRKRCNEGHFSPVLEPSSIISDNVTCFTWTEKGAVLCCFMPEIRSYLTFTAILSFFYSSVLYISNIIGSIDYPLPGSCPISKHYLPIKITEIKRKHQLKENNWKKYFLESDR